MLQLIQLSADKQHVFFIEIMGKYPPCLPEIMRDDTPGETKACLDLGCGSGAWYAVLGIPRRQLFTAPLPRIMELAREFPRGSCVAVDLVPMQSL